MSVGGEDVGSSVTNTGSATNSNGILPALRSGLARFGKIDGAGRWLRTGTGIVSTSVTTLIGVLTLVFLLVPGWRPGSESAALGAELSNPKLEQGVTMAAAYSRAGEQPPADYSAARLGMNGALITFDVVIEGYQGQTCRLTWSLLDDETNTRIDDANFLDQPGWPVGTFQPVADRDQASVEVWVGIPSEPGTYIVRLELYDPNGQRLTSLDSEPITVSDEHPITKPGPGGLPTPSGPGSTGPTSSTGLSGAFG